MTLSKGQKWRNFQWNHFRSCVPEDCQSTHLMQSSTRDLLPCTQYLSCIEWKKNPTSGVVVSIKLKQIRNRKTPLKFSERGNEIESIFASKTVAKNSPPQLRAFLRFLQKSVEKGYKAALHWTKTQRLTSLTMVWNGQKSH